MCCVFWMCELGFIIFQYATTGLNKRRDWLCVAATWLRFRTSAGRLVRPSARVVSASSFILQAHLHPHTWQRILRRVLSVVLNHAAHDQERTQRKRPVLLELGTSLSSTRRRRKAHSQLWADPMSRLLQCWLDSPHSCQPKHNPLHCALHARKPWLSELVS